MGKSNRRKGERPKRRMVAGMAEDIARPTETESLQYHRRTLEWSLHGNLFLMNYLSYVEDGGFSVPGHGKPRAADETAEEYVALRDAKRALVEVQAAAGTWAELCVEELRHIMPSDAASIAAALLGHGFSWCTASGFDPTPNAMRAGATPLLDAVCPWEHRDQAGEVLTVIWGGMVTDQVAVVGTAAAVHPIATIHVAAAITAWLYSQPDCVPDQLAAKMEIIEQTEKALKFL